MSIYLPRLLLFCIKLAKLKDSSALKIKFQPSLSSPKAIYERPFLLLSPRLSSKPHHFPLVLILCSPTSIQKDWTNTLRNMANLIAREQTPTNLLAFRTTFYDLLNHCIPANLILKVNS